MKTVAFIGSMRFADKMKRIARQLEIEKGWCVLQPVYNEDKQNITIDGLENIIACQHRKIELADAVYIININGYIGEATRNEIAYAKKNNKEVIYHECEEKK